MFFDNEVFLQKYRDRDIELSLDQIQAPNTLVIGYFLGTFTKTFNYLYYYNPMKANERFANHQVAFNKRAIKNYHGDDIKGKEVHAVEITCDASKRGGTSKLLKAQYNRGCAADLASLPEEKMYKYVESFSNKHD